MSHVETFLRCHTTACGNAANARGYNRVTGGMYCDRCAKRLNDENPGTPGGPLCPYRRLDLYGGGSHQPGLVVVRQASVTWPDPTEEG